MKVRVLLETHYPTAKGLELAQAAGSRGALSPEDQAEYFRVGMPGDEITDLPAELVDGLVTRGAIEVIKPKVTKKKTTKKPGDRRD